jgi:undecaprenyl-diphosphatase
MTSEPHAVAARRASPDEHAKPDTDAERPSRRDGRGTIVRLVLGFAAMALVAWGAGEAWLSLIGSGELEAVREVASHRTDGLTAAAKIVTWAGSAFLLVPLALLFCIVLVRRGRPREALLVVICLGGAVLLSDVLKLAVERPRPPIEHLQAVASSSFPSEHATQGSAFWLSAVLALAATTASRSLVRLAAAAAIALVLAVAASRVYLGVHYPADVVAGILLGAAWAAWAQRSLH